MWSYYGSKSKLIEYYPIPKYNTIIEPFAGTAQYSLFDDNWRKQVILIDKYKVICDIWQYLINSTQEKIIALPDIDPELSLDNYNLSPVEKSLIGFCINRGSAQPKTFPKKFNNWTQNKRSIAKNLHKIKHWKVINASYEEAPDIEATWFIDPPYQIAGKWYHPSVSNKLIDYTKLGEYCRTRKGQVIVCENIESKWLPFKILTSFHGQLHERKEAIWTNEVNVNLSALYSKNDVWKNDKDKLEYSKKGLSLLKNKKELWY
jgi:hypothetical protein